MDSRLPRPAFAVLAKVRETVCRYRMLEGGEKVLVCVSGGPDSMVLLDVMHRLGGELDLRLEVFHVDHGLRPDSDRDAEHVRRTAAAYGLPFHCERVVVERRSHGGRDLSPEEAAREARYRSFTRRLEASGADRAALGHQADDRVETLLMRLFTGAGPRALASIPPLRGPFIRPLIRVWREEIEAYLACLPLPPLEDPTNRDLAVPRNRVRHLLLPLLEKEFNPKVRQSLERALDLLEVHAGFRGEEGPVLAACGDGVGQLSLDGYLDASEEERLRMLHRALLELGIRPSFRLVESLRRGACEGRPGNRVCLPGGLVAVNEYRRVVFIDAGAWREGWGEPGEEVVPEGGGDHRFPRLGIGLSLSFCEVRRGEAPFPSNPCEAMLDVDKLSFPLRLRHLRPGDRFRPLGAPGNRKVQDFLTDARVPRRERGKVLALLSGEKIAWLVGLRISEDFKVTASTRRAALLRAEGLGGSGGRE